MQTPGFFVTQSHLDPPLGSRTTSFFALMCPSASTPLILCMGWMPLGKAWQVMAGRREGSASRPLSILGSMFLENAGYTWITYCCSAPVGTQHSTLQVCGYQTHIKKTYSRALCHFKTRGCYPLLSLQNRNHILLAFRSPRST